MNVYTALSFASFLLVLQASVFAWKLPAATRERIAYLLSGISFSIFAFFTFLFNFTENLTTVYILDRFASLGWSTFPVLTAWLVYLLRKKRSTTVSIVLKYILAPLALVFITRYWIDPESLKSYSLYGEIWYFEINRAFPWFFLFVVYLMTCMGIILYLLFVWSRDTKSNRTRQQIIGIVAGIITFFIVSSTTNLVIPFLGYEKLPPLAHIDSIFILAGFFYAIIILKPQELSSAIVNRFINNHLKEFVFYYDQNHELYAVNSFCIEKLKYNHSEFTKLNPYAKRNFKHFPVPDGKYVENAEASGNLSLMLTDRSGNTIPVSFQQIRITDNQSNLLGLVLLGKDQTETMKLRQEIAERERNEELLRNESLGLNEKILYRTQELNRATDRLKEELEEMHRTETQNKSDLEQKAVLFQEIHHRVKNNFQIIISLIKMVENNGVETDAAKTFLFHLANKIRAISQVHEYFYSYSKLNRINFSDFIKKISLDLSSEFYSGKQIAIRFNVGTEFLGLHQALPCGLYFHEVLSHTLSHAFKGECKSKDSEKQLKLVVVEFYQWLGEYYFIVSHNGIPFKATLKHAGNGVPNLSLINMLANNYLGGTFSFNAAAGAQYKLVFPLDNANPV